MRLRPLSFRRKLTIGLLGLLMIALGGALAQRRASGRNNLFAASTPAGTTHTLAHSPNTLQPNALFMSGCVTPSFAAAANFATGTTPRSAAVGDFNLDGRPDLVTANQTDENISLRLGDGAGGFGAATNFNLNVGPVSVAVGDFNLDGNPDVATASFNSDTIVVLLGNGAGGFGAPANFFPGGSNPTSVAVGDFNRDGRPDLVTANEFDNNASVLLGNGAGSFGTATNFSSGINPQQVIVADFNLDGRPDLATASQGDNTLQVLLGNGLGSFGAATSFTVGSFPRGVATGDFNQDGRPDLAAANFSSSNVSVILGDGAGNFGAAANFNVGLNPRSIQISDYNQDGKPDVATANENANNVSVLLGDGAGSLSAATNFGVGTGPQIIATGDFNRDGRPDLVSANAATNNASVLLNTCNGTPCGATAFAATANFGTGTQTSFVAAGDFNLDGKPDLATANRGSNNVSVLLGNGAGSFGAATNFAPGTNPQSLAVGDFNRDGKPDIAAANFGSNNVSVLLGNGAGSFGAATNFGAGTQPRSVAVGDFNLDGRPDLAVANGGSNNVSLLLGNGAGSFGAATNFNVGTLPGISAVGDFNQDGNPDLAVANTSSDNVSVLLGNGAGSFGAATNFGVGTNPQAVAVGDFNRDGKPDLAAANNNSVNVSVLLGNGAGSFGAATNFGAGSQPVSVAVGDFNQDGRPDLATANQDSNNVSVLLGNGAGSFAAAANFTALLVTDSVAVGDFNLDGKPDIAAANFGSNNVSVLLNSCAANTPPTLNVLGPLTFSQGSDNNANIAIATDPDQPNNTLTLTVMPLTGSGVSYAGFANDISGTNAAIVSASCAATNSTFLITVTDSAGAMVTGVQTVNVTPNTPPTVGDYPANLTATTGGGQIAIPNAAPSDNGSIASVTGMTIPAQGFTGTLTGNPATGAITIANANPPGTYPVTATTTDNCGLTFTRNFTLTVAAPSASGCATPSFGAAANFAAGTSPRAVVTGDFNLDGRPDMATANTNSNNVSVFLGNGAGGFGAATNFNTDSGPMGLAVADMNLDGRPDLLTANISGGDVSVLLGNGAGGFPSFVSFGAGISPNGIAVGDFNLDGRPDAVVTDFGSTNFSLLLGNGAGALGGPTDFSVGTGPFAVTVGDFNLDGKPDVAVANSNSDNVSVRLGNGAGSFGAATNFNVGSLPLSVAVGDFNQDGRPDLAVANFNDNNVSVLLGNGAGSFGAATNFAVAASPRSVITGDFNLDGRPDLATANFSNSLSLILGNGAGAFGAATNFGTGNFPQAITTGDFNLDGRPDLATANSNSDNASVLLNTCNGTPCGATAFAAATNFAAGTDPRVVAVGDFNLDGKSDLAMPNLVDNNVSILLGTGSGSFGAATNFAVGTQPIGLAVGDFNADGKSDLAVANTASANVSILLGTGSGSFGAATNFAVGSSPASVALGDFNGDGKSDLAVANNSSNNVSILLGTGSGSFGAATNFAVGSTPSFVAVGDFNGDGKSDLAVSNQSSNNVSILLGTGSGSFGAATNFVVGSTPLGLAVGDFNADGNSDLAVANRVSNNVSILLGTGSGSFGVATNFAVGTQPISVVTGDFNLDGKSDLAVTNRNSNNVSILLGTGSGSFGVATNFAVGTNPLFAAVGDFNLDGKSDLAVSNQTSNNVSVLLNSCAANTPPTITAGGPLSRQQGSPASNSTIATVSDAETSAGSVVVTVTSANPSNGVTISNIVNTAGTITADVVADCGISSNATFTLRATDGGGLTNTATLTVNVTANTVPVQGNFPFNILATTGGGQVAIPNAAPTDNGSIVSLNATAIGFTGTLTGNPATGAVTIANAGPAGTYNVVVTATDNCGAGSTSSFTLTVAAPTASGCATPSFGATTNFAAGTNPDEVVTGDFNLDGRPDLAVANQGSDNVSVLLGNGAGSFAAATNFSVGITPRGMVAGDFNLDGRPDLATANLASNNVSVLLGNGAGSFGTATNFSTGTNPVFITTGDFNLDGRPDLVTTNSGSDSVSLLLGNGAGSFGAAAGFSVGTAPRGVSVGDFNLDGRPDLAVANQSSGNVSVLLGNGAGSFGAATNFSVGTFSNSVAVGDFNRDGRPDLAVTNFGGNNVSILLGNGAGSFSAATNFSVGAINPVFVAVGDFNQDGQLDLATGNNGSASVSILLGNGAGGFGASTTFTVGTNPGSLAVGDFNLDGRPDLATANNGSNNASVLLNTCNGTPCGATAFGAATNFAAQLTTIAVTVSDFNLDGKPDLAATNRDSNSVSVFLGNGAGSFGAATNFTAGTNPQAIVAGDFNLDGKPDLATTNIGGSNVSVLLGNGLGGFGAATNFTVGSTPRSIVAGDFNLDGKPDLATANQGGNNVSVLLGNGAGSFGAATNFTVGNTPVAVATGDFNRDGKPDLAAGNFNDSNISILLGNGAGSFGAATNFSVGTNLEALTTGDFNLDGKTDLATANLNNATASVLLGDGAGNFGAAASFAVGSGTNAIVAGDFNRDGKPDLATANRNVSNVSVLAGNGAGSFGAATNFSVGTTPTGLALGDFNLDGKPDLTTANTNSNNITVLLNSCVANTPPTITAGGPLTRMRAATAINSTIATVSDAETAAGSITVAVTSANPSNGVTVSNIVNTGGTITADVGATCAASNATFTLTATDGGGLTNTATLTVNTTSLTSPQYGAFPANLTATTGGGQIAIPSTAPSSPGMITSVTATAPGFTGTFTGDPVTGIITIANANPAGTYTVTATAFDNCGGSAGTIFRLTVVAPSASGCATPSFGAAANFAAGMQPRSVATGDFNLDGKPDMVVANGAFSDVSVLLGNGAGSFGAATNFAAGTQPRGVAVGDFNLDGKPDLAVANNAATLSVLLGNGTGGFGAPTNFTAGLGQVSVAVGDFNLDGKPDLVTANGGNNNVSVLLGNGAGSFGAATNFTAGINPWGVAVGDFNGDGRPDLAVANLNSANVSVLLGNGAGSFGAATNFATGTTPRFVTVGDFNQDGKPDLATANDDALTSNNVSVLPGDGAGSFGAATNFLVGNRPNALAVSDFNLDGRPDITAVNFSSNNASVLLNTCNGTPCGATAFGAATNFAVAANPSGVASGDFNLDGKPDLATANPTANNVSVLAGNGAGGFGAASNFAVGSNPQFVAVGDFNLDGKPDLAVANDSSNNVSVLLGNGFGGFGAATNFAVGINPQFVAVGDFNLDGRPDLAVANFFSDSVSVLLGNGAGSFGAATNFAVGSNPQSVAVGDFNLDGRPDLAAANRNSNNVSVLLGNGAGSFGAATNFAAGAGTGVVAVGDFNLDGRPDLATANFTNTVSVLLGNGAGSFGAATNFAVGTDTRSVAVGDFNRDGKPDLAAANQGSNNVSILLGNGSGSFGAAMNFAAGAGSRGVVVGDFNLDGRPDVVTANLNAANVSVLLNSCVSNTPPTITAGGPLTRQQGSAASNSVIATVSDPDQTAGSVNVAVTSANPSNGVTISNIVNTNGTITADVLAACAATNATFTLTATDSIGAMTNATLTVNVTANTAPTLGTYPTTNVNQAGGATVTPSLAPTDNGSVATLTAAAPGFTGTLTGNPATGVITVSNAGPVAAYTVTVTATDNCGATSNATFTLNVNAISVLTVTNSNDSGAGSLRQAIIDSNSLAGVQTIQFNIPGTGVRVITLSSGLPVITDAVTLDGYTQPGAAPNSLAVGDNAVILIQVRNGTDVGGFTVNGPNVTIRGFSVTEFGETVAFAGRGMIVNAAATNTIIQGNFVGLTPAGTAAGSSNGIYINGANGVQIGGTAPADRNVVSSNGGRGLDFDNASNITIQGNYIGTNLAGTGAMGQGFAGVRINTVTNLLVGGTTGGAGNVVGGNGLSAFNTSALTNANFQGNFIGVGADGTTSLGNGEHGIALTDPVSGVNVGGTTDPERNLIANNTQRGVVVAGGATGRANISGNRIFNNGNLGIDLNNDGVTANDTGDGDTGPNGLQNFPVLAMATSNGANTTVNGTLNSTAATTYRVEFFSNPACDASGNGEGAVFLGTTNVTTDGAGNAAINITTLPNVTIGQVVTATATNTTTNATSEFSACRTVTAPNANPTITAGGPLSRQQGSAASNSNIATVSDADQAANTLSVTATTLTGAGVTVTGLVIDGAGNVTANVAASCTATNSTFTLTVTDNMSASATATLTVNVTANTAPTLGVYGNTMVMATMGATVTPSLAPTDNGSVATLTVSAPGFTGVLTGDPVTGVITITNANPVGTFPVTVTATDNCGAASIANFTLTVNPLLAVIVTNTNDSGAGSLRQAITDSNNNTGVQMVMFNIAGSGVQTITPATPLPLITQPVIIDGYTQPGASPNSLAVGDNAVLLIELNGATANASPGLQINAAGSSVRGLVINNFTNAAGILLTGLGATGNTIDGNFIGINPAGTVAAPNRHGIDLAAGANNNAIGGVTPAARNIVSGNSVTNIRLRNPDTAANTVRGSYIGTNPAGTSAFAGPSGVLLDTDSITNEIGGAMAGAGNVIAGTLDGITIAPGSETNAIRGNFVGLNAAGTGALACEMGIVVIGDANTIGGNTAAARNVISGNTLQGISIAGVNNIVTGNFVGTNAAGTAALPNGGSGVTIFSLSNTIGGAAAGTGNVIFNNGGNGVEIDGAMALNNAVLGNAIGNNAQLGISLTNGANNSQPPPTLALATSNGTNTTVTGTLNSASNTTYRVEFFSNPTCDASGAGEGQIILGFASVTTDGAGNATINSTTLPNVTIGQVVTATATNLTANETSQFSVCRTVTAPNAAPTITAAGPLARQQGSAASNSPIATVADAEQAANTLNVVATSLSGAGVTVTGIAIDGAGNVTANIVAACAATNSTFTLTVTDNMSATATATLTVNVTANTAPTLGVYPNTGPVATGGGATVTPSLTPTDNGAVNTLTASAPGFTGTLTGNPATGVITVSNAAPAGNYTVTVTATDNCGATTNATFTLAVNAAPTITAAGPLSRQQGSAGTISPIATISDVDQAANTLNFSFTPLTGAGVTISAIAIDGAGNVTANVAASCTATNSTFTLTVTDNMSATATATLTVNVTANTAPTLGIYPSSTAITGGGVTVTPSVAPTDNGSVATLTASAPGFSGTLTGNPLTGVITVTNAGPGGNYTVTVTATDNCGATTNATFTLAVNAAPTITAAGPLSRQQGSAGTISNIATISDVDQAANALNFSFTPLTGAGVTISAIAIDGAGNVTANVAAGCAATNSTFTLTVTDNMSATATATLTVNVTANTAPTIGTYPNTSIVTANSATVTPSLAPTDNGSVVTLTATASGGFTGTLSGVAATGVVTIVNAAPAGVYAITVTATDNCGATTNATFNLAVNAAPTIAAASLARQQGSPTANSQIATVSDFDQAANTLNVVATPLSGAGVTVSNILVNGAGVVTADVTASCAATNSTFTLTVTDNQSATATAVLSVSVNANTPPALGLYSNTGVAMNSSVTVTPSAPPSDNGTIASLTVMAAGGFSGTISINPLTGVVTVNNAAPIGNFVVTITATDNCGATSNTTFMLSALMVTTVNVTNTNDSGAGSLRQALLDANALTGLQTIVFNIAGSGVQTITPVSALPTITDPVTIDGMTQPGFSGTPLIELNGAGLVAHGLTVTAGSTTVKSLIINRFNGNGILLTGGGGNTIQGSRIGTNAAGTAALANNGRGISIVDSANNTIGGAAAGAGNLVSGNSDDGIAAESLTPNAANGNTIQGNFVGTNAAGTAAIPNGDNGIAILGANNCAIGGVAAGAGNLVSGNGEDGIEISGLSGGNNNTAQGNRIGTNAAGAGALGNAGDGVHIFDNASGNTIGGALAGAGNIIANNGNAGVRINSPNALNNSVLGNAISANAQLGLDLNGDGVSPNDTGDGDTGANNLQNFPALNFVTNTGTVNASLNSAANAAFRVEFFANTSCDSSGNGEGQLLLGAVNVNTDGAGNANNFTFNFTPNAGLPFLTATATDGSGNTSEFSQCRQINTLPAINAAAPVSRQQGSAGVSSQIATVSDSDQTANTLNVVATPLSGSGVTVSGIAIDGAGNVTANIAASCTATNASFTLTVTDNANQTATANLTVNVTANTAPTLGTYANTSLMTGQSTTVTPSTAPADNGSVVSLTASASAGFTGTLAGNPTTGAITINTAAPAGVYTITVTVTDNCGATTNRTFALAVNVLPVINAAAPLTRQQGSPASVSQIAVVSDSDQAANTLNVTATPLTGAGVTISGIAVNAAGAVIANVVAACAATNATFTLTVTDSQNQTATAVLTVNVNANTPPVVGVYPTTNVLPGQNTTVTPSLAPTDNGNIVSLTAAAPGFTGAFAGNPATGVITVTNANPSGSFIVTVTATDNCGATTTANFTLGVNAGPSITAAGALTRQQGSPSLNSQIATVADVDQPANTLSVTVTPLSGAGVTVTGISINAAGSVTANVAASCAATNSTFTLTVTDNMGLTATATLTVNVTANTPPTLGAYSQTLVVTGQGATVTPSLPPSDNGSIVSLTATAPGFTGTFSGNPLTGVITIANAGPAGVFAVTVTATDNCGATRAATFNLNVNATPTITAGAATRQQGSPAASSPIATVNDPDQALNTLTVVATPLTGSGVTVSGLSVSGAGVVTANIVASCAATNSTFTLTVTDNMGATATAVLTVNVNANTPPTLGNYPASAVTLAGNTTIPTNATPTDNGNIVSLTATAPGFTGTLTGNLSTGVITVTNAGPAGAFPVTVMATDNCGATTTANFTLTVNALAPSLAGINPNNGPLFGGTNVTLTGVNFAAPGAVNTQVFFGTNPATSVVVVNDTTITAVAPAGASVGVVGVRVVNGNGFTNFVSFNYNQVISDTTPLGENVRVDLGDITVIFSQVTSLGVTSASQIDPATAGVLPAGYTLTPDSRAFELNTTAVYTGNVVVCIRNNAAPNIQAFARKRIMHGEGGPTLIDRTILPPNDPSFNFNTRRVCARVTSFSPFVVASTTTSFTINGTILDNSGVPATGVRVRVNLPGNQTPLLVADTDANGQYVLPGLISGSYVVTPARTGSAFLPANRTFTNVSTDQTADFVLVNPAARFNISGRVTNSQTGAGSPNVRINLAGVGGILRALTQADGTYQFPGVFGGNYSLTAERPGFSFAPSVISLENLSAEAVNQNFVGTPVVTPTPTPEPGDDFSDAGRDPNRWSIGIASERAERFDPQVSVTQGADPQFPNRLRVRPRSGVDGPSFSGYVSARPINLNQQSQAGVRAVRPATGAMAATAFSIGTDSLNYSRIIVTSAPLASLGIATNGPNAARILSQPTEGGQMIVYQNVTNGQSTATVQAYNNVQQQFWRYRYDAINQLLFLETSPDGLIWTLRATQNLANAGAEGFISELIAGTFDSTINPGLALFGEYRVVPPIGLRFAASNSSVSETGGNATITVVRDGNTEIPSKVDYATSNGTAIANLDYRAVSGTLTFNVGETSKTFNVPILDDFLLEGGAPETVNLMLSNASGSLLGTPNTATLGIVDDESGTNPIDDPGFFVDQHYSDFLSRSPDVSGRNYWVGQITQCGANVACINGKRIDVSAAFFNESEFFETGGLVYRLYRISHLRAPNFAEFEADRRLVVAGPNLAGSQVAYANNYAGRAEFLQRYNGLNSIAFVDALFANAGITPTEAERAFLITNLASGGLTRGQVLLSIANRARDDAGFRQRENNRLFVLMQYFGYLRRNIDQAGFDFWLDVLQRTSNIRGMVCAFITSEEYQRRFAPIVTRTNAECANVNGPENVKKANP